MEPYPVRYSKERLEKAASRLKIENPGAVISLDHDFFYPIVGQRPVQENIHDELMLSTALKWSVEEWFSKKRQMRAWKEAENRLTTIGYDPKKAASIDETRWDSIYALKQWHDLERVYMGDSHLWGLVVCMAMKKKTQKPVHLIHYDAHHDMGYTNYRGDSLEKAYSRMIDGASCDDWIWAGLEWGIIDRVDIIYPDWSGVLEWHTQTPTLAEDARVSVHMMSYWETIAEQEAGVCLYARSSAFIPPWDMPDLEYLKMARELCKNPECLDCKGYLQIGSQNACQIRK